MTALAPPPAPTGRAGRNLPAAIAVGLSLGAVIVVPLVVYKPAFIVVLALAVLAGTYEMVRALRSTAVTGRHARLPLLPLALGNAAMVVAAYRSGEQGLAVALLVTVLATVAWRLRDTRGDLARELALAGFVAVYVGGLAGFAALLTAPSDGVRRVVTYIATAVASDVGGYAAGVLFGRHPLAPSVSPKKTWEGAAGSLLSCLVAGALLCGLVLHLAIWQGLVFGAATVVMATLGDLTESLIKRDLDLKDMGTLLPGHGGLMDRLDSLLLTAPVAYLLITAFR